MCEPLFPRPADETAARRLSVPRAIGASNQTVLTSEITADGLTAAPKKRRASTVVPTAVPVAAVTGDAPPAATAGGRRASVAGTGRRASMRGAAQAVMAAEGMGLWVSCVVMTNV